VPAGLAHAVEHMAHRGGPRYDAAAYSRLMQSLGADGSALTTDDWTGYFVTLRPPRWIACSTPKPTG